MKNFSRLIVFVLVALMTLSAQPIFAIALYQSYAEVEFVEGVDIQIEIGELDVFGVFNDLDEALARLEDDEFVAQLNEIRQIMKRQSPMVAAYNVIIETFINDYGQLVYPDNFAGAYVGYDTLVIQLTDLTDESIGFYTSLLGYDAPISFKEVDFSTNQLAAFGEVFLHAVDVPVLSFGTDTMNNVFSVTVYQNCEESLQLIENFDATRRFLPIPVAIDIGMPAETTVLRGGTEITRVQGTPGFSVGITGWARGIAGSGPALVTTGHVFRNAQPGANVWSGNQLIGTLSSFRMGYRLNTPGLATGPTLLPFPANFPLVPGRDGDFAIITLTSDAFLTNELRNGVRPIGTSTRAPVGTFVMGVGRLSIWAGLIRETNFTVTMPRPDSTDTDYYIHGLTRVAPTIGTPIQGDSGGAIFYEFNIPGSLNMVTLFSGVQSAKTIRSNGQTYQWYYSPLISFHNYFSPRIVR